MKKKNILTGILAAMFAILRLPTVIFIFTAQKTRATCLYIAPRTLRIGLL